jgi:general L-amino acid transport system permease protein
MADARPQRPSLLSAPAVRAALYQLALVGGVVAVGAFLIHNTLQNLARQGIATGFAFLHSEAAFQIGERLIDYSPASSYGRAFLVGLLNTLLVAAIGIVLATILGTLVGIARLSTNWLIRKLASVYVETLRNVPVLLQLIVWWDLLHVSAPSPRQAWQPLPDVFVSNRGIAFPVLAWQPEYSWMALAAALGIAAAIAVARWAHRRQMATGRQFPVLAVAAALILLPALLVFVATGMPLHPDVPALRGFNFIGGVTASPEFAALVIGLTAYTASYIAEIVRGGILAIGRGQSEAAAALGLRRGRTLRLVVLPQALRIIVPPLTSQYLNLAKNSSLAVAIGYPDLTSIGNTTGNQTGQSIEAIAIAMSVYLAISLSISLVMNWYNRNIRLVER